MGIHVLYLVKYYNDQKAAMIAKPDMRDRAEVHCKAILDFGGRPIAPSTRLGRGRSSQTLRPKWRHAGWHLQYRPG